MDISRRNNRTDHCGQRFLFGQYPDVRGTFPLILLVSPIGILWKVGYRSFPTFAKFLDGLDSLLQLQFWKFGLSTCRCDLHRPSR